MRMRINLLGLLIIFSLVLTNYLLTPELARADNPQSTENNTYLELSSQRLRPKGIPKIESALSQLVDYDVTGKAKDFAQSAGLVLKDDMVRVIIEVTSGREDAISDFVASLGGTVETSYQNLIQAMVPISHIKTLAVNNEIKMVSQPLKSVELTLSEGVNIVNANNWHSNGLMASGVKIGILAAGFAGYDSLLGTELPTTVEHWWAPSRGGGDKRPWNRLRRNCI